MGRVVSFQLSEIGREYNQKHGFSDETLALQHGINVEKNSPIYILNSVLQDIILCVGGILKPEESKQPVFLPKYLHH